MACGGQYRTLCIFLESVWSPSIEYDILLTGLFWYEIFMDLKPFLPKQIFLKDNVKVSKVKFLRIKFQHL